jgi:hypothetical protein
MPANYPASIRTFSNKRNFVDVIDSTHPNSLQEEVVALQATVGTLPATSTAPSSSGTFVSTSTNFGTLVARLANIETGIVADSHTQYVKRVGGSVVTPATAVTVGVTVRAASGQTANLQEWRNSANTVVASVDASGNLKSSGINVATEQNTNELLGIIIADIF